MMKKRGRGMEMKAQRRKYRGHEKREESWRWPEAKKADTQHEKWAPPQSCTLPLDLVVEHILSRLSVRQICRLRCVCKAWNFVLVAGKFLPDKAKESWFLMRSQSVNKQTGRRALTAFSSSDDSPFQPPLAGAKLSSYLGGSDWTRLGEDLDCPCTHFIASAGGLICTLVRAVYAGTFHDVIVFNCFTGSVKVLPRPPSQDETLDEITSFSMHMAVDNQDPFQYYVMIASRLRRGYMDSEVAFEVFDSRSGGWKVGNGSPSSTMIKSSTGLADGDLFDSIYHASDGMMDVLAYHAAEDAWSSVQVPLICNDPRPRYLRFPKSWSLPTFLKYEGRLFMGRMLVEDKPFGFEVWELQFSSLGTATLVEVARTPEHLYQPSSMVWTLKAEGFVFCMHLEEMPKGKRPPLVYDIVQNSWYVVPGEEGVDCILVHRPRPSMFWYG